MMMMISRKTEEDKMGTVMPSRPKISRLDELGRNETNALGLPNPRVSSHDHSAP